MKQTNLSKVVSFIVKNIIICLAIVKHLICGFLIIFTPFPLNTSTLAVLNKLFTDYRVGGMLLIISALFALYGAIAIQNPYKTVFFYLPVLFFVWLFGLTALNAVFQGHFADGVIRPWQFIFADQITPILLLFFVSLIIFEPIWHKKKYE